MTWPRTEKLRKPGPNWTLTKSFSKNWTTLDQEKYIQTLLDWDQNIKKKTVRPAKIFDVMWIPGADMR